MISIYNTERKELMAIFASTSMAASYVYGQFNSSARERIGKRLTDSFRITDSLFPYPLAVRYSTGNHVKMLGEKDGVIFEGYPEVRLINIGGRRFTNFLNEKPHESIP